MPRSGREIWTALRRHLSLIGLVVALISSAAACSSSSAAAPKDPCPQEAQTSPIGPNLLNLIFTSAAGQTVLCVRPEANEQERERGLMNVTKLPDDQGDLFLWPEYGNQDINIPFWMKDTPLPLSIVFVSADGHVLGEADMQPETDTLHSPPSPYRYAIEANLGWYAKHKITSGSTVDLPAALISLRPH
jgi:uncharacterized protein